MPRPPLARDMADVAQWVEQVCLSANLPRWGRLLRLIVWKRQVAGSSPAVRPGIADRFSDQPLRERWRNPKMQAEMITDIVLHRILDVLLRDRRTARHAIGKPLR